MKVGIVVGHGLPHQQEHAEALAEGMGRHGIETTLYAERGGFLPPEQVCACWGWRIGQALRQGGKDVLVMERGFVDRMNWCSLGWNGLNGRARRTWEALDTRAALFATHLRPWRPDGSYALLCGQVSGDMSVAHIVLSDWYAEASTHLANLGLPVKFRPHPMALKFGQKDHVPGADTLHSDLQTALDGAAVVATFNSNTGVESILAGKPTIARDPGSMAWPVAAHDWTIQTEPARVAWLAHLASSQFSLAELRNGFAWDVVKDSQTLQ